MTYQQLHDALRNKATEKSKVFVFADTKISQTNGFGDIEDLPEYAKAKMEWDFASNNYRWFLYRIKGKNINPNDEVDINFLYL